MDLSTHRSEILQTLRRKTKSALRDENVAWPAIEASVNSALGLPSSVMLENLVYSLALIYVDQTGAMPGFSNSDNETLFERFAASVIKPVMPMVTRNQVKYAIRKMDARKSGRFRADLGKLTTGLKLVQNIRSAE
jgi:hypothetical protein